MSRSSASAMSRSTRPRCPMALASITRMAAPSPRRVDAPLFGVPGPSSAGQVSMATAMSGAMRWAAVRAPRSPTSSWAVAVACTSMGEGPAVRRPSSITYTPTRSSRAFPVTRSPTCARSRTRVATSPFRTISCARSPGRPRSMVRSSIFGAFDLAASSSRWTGVVPTMPSRSSRPCTSTRWPTRVRASQPPRGMNLANPRSSTCVIMRPISSMWAASIRRPRGSPVASRTPSRHPIARSSTRSADAARWSRTMCRTRSSAPGGPEASANWPRSAMSIRRRRPPARPGTGRGWPRGPGSRRSG